MTGFPIGRPRFITLDECLAFHELLIARFGGSLGVRDRGLLESALSMPRQSYSGEFAHLFPFEMAAAYAFHLSKNHPFVDGNKRIALMCCGSFLRMNGWNLTSTGESAADAIIALVEGRLTKQTFSQWLVDNARPRPSYELRDFLLNITLQDFVAAAARLDLDTPGTRPIEIAQTLFESQSLPLVDQLILHWKSAVERDDAKSAALYQDLVKVFAALYRLAEDRGYEW